MTKKHKPISELNLFQKIIAYTCIAVIVIFMLGIALAVTGLVWRGVISIWGW